MGAIIRQNWLGVLGVIGLCIALVFEHGLMQNSLNVVAMLALIAYSWIFKNEFFFFLEGVALFGTIFNIVQMNARLSFAILSVVTVLALIKILRNKANQTKNIIFGIIGFIGLVFGYATLNPLGFTLGGIGLIIYSFVSFKHGVKVALIFGILNVIYTALAIYAVVTNFVS